MLSKLRLKRQGEEVVKAKLPGSTWGFNGHDIDWDKIKINVRVRGRSGMSGEGAFVFSSFKRNDDAIYILVGFDENNKYFWVLNQHDINNKTSYYASVSNAIKLKDLPEVIKMKASYEKDF